MSKHEKDVTAPDKIHDPKHDATRHDPPRERKGPPPGTSGSTIE